MTTRNKAALRADETINKTHGSRGRKNRARWCGGHVGREHRYVYGRTKNTYVGPWGDTCRFIEAFHYDHETRTRVKIGKWWHCAEQEYCESCGRVKRNNLNLDCPTRPADARTLAEVHLDRRR